MKKLVGILTVVFLLMGGQVFAQPAGTYLGNIPWTGAGGVPVGAEHNGAGRLWITDIEDDTISLMDTTGTITTIIDVSGTVGNPIGVSIATGGDNLFVTDTTSDQVYILDMAGAVQSSFSVAAQTTFPEGITYNPLTNHLFVVDGSGGNNVYEYDLAGTLLDTYPVNGISQDGIAFDPNTCTYWVYDSGTDTINQYDDTFTSMASFPGTVEAGLASGEGVAVIGNTLYVVATGSDAIAMFDITGAHINPNGCAAAAVTPIPTLSEWGMILMSLMLAGTAIWMIRKRQVL